MLIQSLTKRLLLRPHREETSLCVPAPPDRPHSGIELQEPLCLFQLDTQEWSHSREQLCRLRIRPNQGVLGLPSGSTRGGRGKGSAPGFANELQTLTIRIVHNDSKGVLNRWLA